VTANQAISHKDMGTNKILNLGNGVNPQDGAAFGQVQTAQSAAQAYTDAAVAALTSGQVLKGKVRAVVSANVNIAAPGTTLDGLAAGVGEIFWLNGQTTGSQGGPYVFNGAAVPMTRAPNWDIAGEAVVGSYWVVAEGTQADKFALLTNDTFVLNTTTPALAFFSALMGGAYNAITLPVGAASAGGSAVVTHNLNSRNLGYSLRRTATPYDYVDGRVENTTVNTSTVLPDIAISASEYTLSLWVV
jgi:hypothetical protein